MIAPFVSGPVPGPDASTKILDPRLGFTLVPVGNGKCSWSLKTNSLLLVCIWSTHTAHLWFGSEQTFQDRTSSPFSNTGDKRQKRHRIAKSSLAIQSCSRETQALHFSGSNNRLSQLGHCLSMQFALLACVLSFPGANKEVQTAASLHQTSLVLAYPGTGIRRCQVRRWCLEYTEGCQNPF